MRSVRAAWIRGGTSKGLFFQAADLPPPGRARDQIILAALGSPDKTGMQLNGLGGGISSTSKVAVISRSGKEHFDVDYLFGQVGIKDRHIDWSGNCGNLAAGAGLFALVEGLIEVEKAAAAAKEAGVNGHRLNVWQANHEHGMSIHFAPGVVGEGGDATSRACGMPHDDSLEVIEVGGVGGREPPIYVEMSEPHGKRPLLPTGNVIDTLELPDGSPIEATLVTAGNPVCFVRASGVGLAGTELPADMDYDVILPLVEHLRSAAAPLFGIPKSDAMRVAFVSEPQTYKTASGDEVAEEAHILSRISTPGRIHHAHTGTGAIALSCASRVEGSVPWQCIPADRRPAVGKTLCIGHPGGTMEVVANVVKDDERGWHATGAGFIRTARYLMRGTVFVPHVERAP
eukprot:TRINITY_DN122529_c0_g1_i1.p1 TRINITY_DN122529_c0_g1~~TRINITY_DN122529_c0_g1_i1.p1  ORF type:complete len:400 (+),score=82.23 TRINITY_DN122529_c0_g1_i1:130-1329(+)